MPIFLLYKKKVNSLGRHACFIACKRNELYWLCFFTLRLCKNIKYIIVIFYWQYLNSIFFYTTADMWLDRKVWANRTSFMKLIYWNFISKNLASFGHWVIDLLNIPFYMNGVAYSLTHTRRFMI